MSGVVCQKTPGIPNMRDKRTKFQKNKFTIDQGFELSDMYFKITMIFKIARTI
jgi:hypothetical protein